MSMFKRVTLRHGPCDGYILSVDSNAASTSLRYLPTQEPLTSRSPLEHCNVYDLLYEFAYHDYDGEVFAYRDQHGLPVDGQRISQSKAWSGDCRVDDLVYLLRSYLDVAVLRAELRNGALTLTWRWRINGDNYQFAHKMPILTALQSRSDIDRVVEFLHNVFLCGVSQHFQYSVDTDESAPA